MPILQCFQPPSTDGQPYDPCVRKSVCPYLKSGCRAGHRHAKQGDIRKDFDRQSSARRIDRPVEDADETGIGRWVRIRKDNIRGTVGSGRHEIATPVELRQMRPTPSMSGAPATALSHTNTRLFRTGTVFRCILIALSAGMPGRIGSGCPVYPPLQDKVRCRTSPHPRAIITSSGQIGLFVQIRMRVSTPGTFAATISGMFTSKTTTR